MTTSYALGPEGLEYFTRVRGQAIDAVTARFYDAFPAEYARFGEPGRKACQEDLAFQLDFLRPVLEFDALEPYVEFQRWVAEVLAARNVPAAHVGLSLTWLAEFFLDRLPGETGERIAAALREASRQAAQVPVAVQSPAAEAWPDQAAFVAAALNGDRRGARSIVDRLTASGRSLVEVYVGLIEASLCEVGERWLHNQVSVAQEHLATATVRTVMAEAFTSARFSAPNGKKALFACVEGNQHSVGLQMLADAYELEGWKVQCLGGDTPRRALVDQVEAWQPLLVGLSISFPHHLGAARDTIRLLRERLGGKGPRVLVGGRAVNRFGALVEHLHADGSASDALAALRSQASVGRE
jgi:methanogenic corrinoid protein MtbC1